MIDFLRGLLPDISLPNFQLPNIALGVVAAGAIYYYVKKKKKGGSGGGANKASGTIKGIQIHWSQARHTNKGIDLGMMTLVDGESLIIGGDEDGVGQMVCYSGRGPLIQMKWDRKWVARGKVTSLNTIGGRAIGVAGNPGSLGAAMQNPRLFDAKQSKNNSPAWLHAWSLTSLPGAGDVRQFGAMEHDGRIWVFGLNMYHGGVLRVKKFADVDGPTEFWSAPVKDMANKAAYRVEKALPVRNNGNLGSFATKGKRLYLGLTAFGDQTLAVSASFNSSALSIQVNSSDPNKPYRTIAQFNHKTIAQKLGGPTGTSRLPGYNPHEAAQHGVINAEIETDTDGRTYLILSGYGGSNGHPKDFWDEIFIIPVTLVY